MSEQEARFKQARTSVTWEEIALSSIAQQLKRIADALEWQQPFEWQGDVWSRSYIGRVCKVYKGSSKWEVVIVCKGDSGEDFTCVCFDTEAEALAARAEFVRLWRGT
jgi:hypothetical protein